MNDLEECLASFDAAAAKDPKSAKAMVIDAIQQFLEAGPQRQCDAIACLRNLQDAYRSKYLKGELSEIIEEAVGRRIDILSTRAASSSPRDARN